MEFYISIHLCDFFLSGLNQIVRLQIQQDSENRKVDMFYVQLLYKEYATHEGGVDLEDMSLALCIESRWKFKKVRKWLP